MVAISRYYFIILIIFFTSGCSAYRYELSKKGYNGGYLIRRHGLVIPEYTVDAENNAPKDKTLATARFRRRKNSVNYYYKEMGRIYDDTLSHLSDFGKAITGPFRLPGAAVENYRYEHNEVYKDRVDEKNRNEDELRLKIRGELKKELKDYIKRDVELEEILYR
jgi:hypothetical protein